MELLSDLGFGVPWIVGMAILTASQWVLFRLAKAGQERQLTRMTQLMEARIRRAVELERAQIEARFQMLSAEQKESFEQVRAGVLESGLRSRFRPELPPAEGGSRLEKRHQVLALAQMGLDSREISRKLRLSRGETDLLLGLQENFTTGELRRG